MVSLDNMCPFHLQHGAAVLLLLLGALYPVHGHDQVGHRTGKRATMHLVGYHDLGKMVTEKSFSLSHFYFRLSWIQKPEKIANSRILQLQVYNQEEKSWPQVAAYAEKDTTGYLSWG